MSTMKQSGIAKDTTPTRKRILFLDDAKHRRDKMAQMVAPHHYLKTVRTAKGAIAYLELAEYPDGWDLVSLDHDLGEKVFVPSDEKSGMEVAKYIAKEKPPIGLVVVHSWNLNAAKRMEAVLKDAGYNVERAMFGMFEYNL